ncbi:hypothetical protein [Streptosporangium sp. 'caverna']|uniref:hypothetical protein n=1 Tax=Streptosporangium sp. 'caverna' TaxID=2202249 RepID=UPI0013A6F027|nr:hypothetical protein [Streptosporangium sp. 'caverna']
MNETSPGRVEGGGLLPESKRRSARPGPSRRTGLFVLLVFVIGAGFLYLNRHDEPEALPEWKPGPFDPPVQYAFIPEKSDCRDHLADATEDAEAKLVTCSEWTLHTNYKNGQGRQELDLTYGMSCAGVKADEDDCSSDIQLFDAASQVQIDDSYRQGVPLRITPDGHFISYFSKSWMRYVGWDLRAGQRKSISPRLDAETLNDLRSVNISPDGRFFTVAFSGTQPRLLITDFATGQTSTVPGFCRVLGLSQAAAVIAAKRACTDIGEDGSKDDTVTILNRSGLVTGEWKGRDSVNDLSPDGRLLVEVLASVGEDGKEHLVVREAKTGKVVRTLTLRLLSESSDAVGYGWLNNDEYILQAETPEPGGSFGYYRVNIRTGKSLRIRDLALSLGEKASLGNVRIKN